MKKQTHVPYGLISGIIMAIISLLIYITGMTFKTGVAWLPFIVFLVGLILNANAYSKANDGYITFGNAFGSCFKATMIATIIMIGYAVLTIVVFPEMKDKMIADQYERLAKNPRITEEAIDMTLDIQKKYWNVLNISGALFTYMIAGAIFSLIAAAVAKKKGERPMTSGDNF